MNLRKNLTNEEINLSLGLNIEDKCIICDESINLTLKDDNAKCPKCTSYFHIICLAENSLKENIDLKYELIPKETICLICTEMSYWNDYITFL